MTVALREAFAVAARRELENNKLPFTESCEIIMGQRCNCTRVREAFLCAGTLPGLKLCPP